MRRAPGTLWPGQAVTAAEAHEVIETRVLETWFAGRRVFVAPGR